MHGYAGSINPESDVFQRFINYYENNRASGYFMGNMDREITYIGTGEYVWQHIYLSTGQWKKAFAATQTNLKYGMTKDTYQVQERFSRRDPAFTCWQPNGSGNGRMIDMMLNSIYFESDQNAILLGCIPFSWLIANRVTSLKNLYTLNGRINIEVSAFDSRSCEVTLSAVDQNALPANIRFPEDLHAKTKSSSVLDKGYGFFTIKGHPESLKFKISKD